MIGKIRVRVCLLKRHPKSKHAFCEQQSDGRGLKMVHENDRNWVNFEWFPWPVTNCKRNQTLDSIAWWNAISFPFVQKWSTQTFQWNELAVELRLWHVDFVHSKVFLTFLLSNNFNNKKLSNTQLLIRCVFSRRNDEEEEEDAEEGEVDEIRKDLKESRWGGDDPTNERTKSVVFELGRGRKGQCHRDHIQDLHKTWTEEEEKKGEHLFTVRKGRQSERRTVPKFVM